MKHSKSRSYADLENIEKTPVSSDLFYPKPEQLTKQTQEFDAYKTDPIATPPINYSIKVESSAPHKAKTGGDGVDSGAVKTGKKEEKHKNEAYWRDPFYDDGTEPGPDAPAAGTNGAW